jgi:hypothetical protein
MNRAQKRAIVQSNHKIYTEPEVRTLLENMRRTTQEKTLLKSYEIYVEVFKMALRDEFDFGSSRMQRVFDKVNTIFKALDKKELTLEMIKEAMAEELKVTVR